jgi:hypothetical protein
MKRFSIGLLLIATVLSAQTTSAAFPEDFDDVKWIDSNISGWKETTKLNVSIVGSLFRFDFDKLAVWPAHYSSILQSSCCVYNIWAFIKYDDQWHAATWEWNSRKPFKAVSSFDGGHINRPPFRNSGQGGPDGWWEPKFGEIYGFMVSDFARYTLRDAVHFQRSDVAFYQWGVGPVDASVLLPPSSVNITPIIDLVLDSEED